MSFASEQKEFIINQQYKSSCCRRAVLLGAMFAKGRLDGDVILTAEKQEAAEFLYRLILEFYGKDADIYTEDTGGRKLNLSFDSKSAANYISSLAVGAEPLKPKCDSCMSSFLRGVFLVSGRASDPAKQYSLEFSLGDRSDVFVELLSGLGLSPLVSVRKGEKIVYFKKSDDIEDFFGHCALNSALFSVMDAKVEGELRKSAMRLANCETNNIVKAVSAARKQIEVIEALERADLLSLLPDELEATARLRMQYADYSLAQLAQVSVPAISKPGLSHRLKKIIELGEHILESKK